jgi:HAD superfamily hydrolase (TIGR01509 family)
MMPPSALIWDLDGTLVDSEPVHFLALTDALAQLGVAAPPELHPLMLGRSLPEVHAYCATALGLAASCEELSALKLAAYGRHAALLRPRADAVELFGRLRDRRAAQAIVSNSDRVIVDVNLRALGLVIPDLVTVSRNDVLLGKPDPEPFLRAAHLLRAAPGECVVVEDSPVGAAAGLAAGMRVICFPEPRTGPPLLFPAPAAVARDGGELAALLGLAQRDRHRQHVAPSADPEI